MASSPFERNLPADHSSLFVLLPWTSAAGEEEEEEVDDDDDDDTTNNQNDATANRRITSRGLDMVNMLIQSIIGCMNVDVVGLSIVVIVGGRWYQ